LSKSYTHVTRDQLSDGLITDSEVASDAAISISKLDSSVASKSYVDSSILTAITVDNQTISSGPFGFQVVDSSITTSKLANSSVTKDKISSSALGGGLTGGDGTAISINMEIETPSGTVDGSNLIFTLSNAPHQGKLILFRNGLFQANGNGMDYTLSGSTITFAGAPKTGDTLIASYFH